MFWADRIAESIQKEGEGDRSIEKWGENFRKFFRLEDDNVEVVCEEFEMTEKTPQ